MRQREVLLVVLVILTASVPAVALPSPSGPFLPRGPISIMGDADFTVANGVVSGTGLPGNPFVIAGWSITTIGGTAIKVHNVTKEFVIRDNAIDARIGVQVTASASIGVVQNNKFIIRGTGVLVANADAHIVDNSFIGEINTRGLARGVELFTSNSLVESNAFLYVQFAVIAERGSPVIRCNDMHDDVIVSAILVRYTSDAVIECNIITRCNGAISSVSAYHTIIVNNTILSCRTGISVTLTKDVEIANNTIRASAEAQVTIDTVSGNFTGNLVIDGEANGVVLIRSPILFANSTISNHVGVAVKLTESAADVHANVMARNGVGLALSASGGAHITANVMTNNTVGIDIPYESRQAIVNLSANVVNGVNIDGALNASQQVYFYKAANVTIDAQVRDSGFSAGYFGSITAQGGVVLYEVDTATINASVISHHNVAVGVVNSFNVNVNASALVSNLIGVKAEVKVGGPQVPNCVVSIKDTNITIPVDPIATVGIELRGCFGIVGRVNISIVDTGVFVDGSAALTMFNSTVTDTKLALDVRGTAGGVNLTGNVIVNNRAGARFSGTIGSVDNNTFHDNDAYGLRLERASNVVLTGNEFSANGEGVLDGDVCLGPFSCSKVTARGNVFAGNVGNGALVHGDSSWRGDLAMGNGGSGFVLGSTATLRAVVATQNEGDGARIVGGFTILASNFTANENDGLDLRGSGEVRDTNATFNAEAGMRIAGPSVTAFHVNASFNFDGIVVGEAILPGGNPGPISTATLLAALQIRVGASPLDLHRSSLLGNERDALRAGATVVNATHNYWGSPNGPSLSVADTVGAFQNGVSPTVRFVPYYTDPSLTTTGPVAGL